MIPRKMRRLAVVGLVAALLTACEVGIPELPKFGKKIELPACPSVRVLPDASQITQYRDGPGRDITDIVYEGGVVGFVGDCEFIGDHPEFTAVKVVIRPTFDLSRGPAAGGRTVNMRYFVAIPAFYPKPQGRSELAIQAAFPENKNTMRIRDEEVTMTIPLSDSLRSPNAEIFLGFVLTEEQLSINRERRKSSSGRR